MSLTGTRGAAHHEERWSFEKGMTPHEVQKHVIDVFYGASEALNPVGWAYDPATGEARLFYQVATDKSKPIGHIEEKNEG